MNDDYRIMVGSLIEYDDLIAEIYVNDRFVGLISQEQAPGIFVLEFAAQEAGGPLKVELALFEAALDEAKSKLRALKRV